MSKVVGEKIAKANVVAEVKRLINLDNATAVHITIVPGEPGFYRIEADIPDDAAS